MASRSEHDRPFKPYCEAAVVVYALNKFSVGDLCRTVELCNSTATHVVCPLDLQKAEWEPSQGIYTCKRHLELAIKSEMVA